MRKRETPCNTEPLSFLQLDTDSIGLFELDISQRAIHNIPIDEVVDRHPAVGQDGNEPPTLDLLRTYVVDDEDVVEDRLGRKSRKPTCQAGDSDRVRLGRDEDSHGLDVVHGGSFRSGCFIIGYVILAKNIKSV